MANSNYDSRRKHIDPEVLVRLATAGYTAHGLRLVLNASPKGGRR